MRTVLSPNFSKKSGDMVFSAVFKSASYLHVFCPRPLLLLALVISYRDPGQNVHCHFALLNIAQLSMVHGVWCLVRNSAPSDSMYLVYRCFCHGLMMCI